MTSSTLFLAILGGWSYAGFAEEPTGLVTLKAEAAVHNETTREADSCGASAVSIPSVTQPAHPLGAAEEPMTARVAEPPTTQAQEVPPSATAQRWRGMDLRGQMWESEDPAALRGFLRARNAEIQAETQPTSNFAPVPATSSLGGFRPSNSGFGASSCGPFR